MTNSAANPVPVDTSGDPSAAQARLATILLYVVPVFFCTNMLVAKATADLIPPIHLAFLRWSATFVLLLPFVGGRLWFRRGAILREWKDLLLLGGLGMGICGAFVYIGADTTTATNIGLLYSASPVLITILAAFFCGETITRFQVMGIAASLSGVLVIVCKGDPMVLMQLDFVAGDLWILAAVFAWAAYSILLRVRPSEMGLSTRFAATALAGVVVLAPFTVWEAAQGDHVAWTWEVVGWIAILAVIASFGAYQLYAYVQRILGAGRTGVLLYLAPVYTAGLAWMLLGEEPKVYHWIGAALVLPGLMLTSRKPRK